MTQSETILLTTVVKESGLEARQFRISFSSRDDLVKRIVGLIRSRMDRIRYVWPYQEEYPAVVRDVELVLRKRTLLKAQKITWLNFESNLYEADTPFDVAVVSADFHKFRLSEGKFPKTQAQKLDFDPMSNIAYRVVLCPDSPESAILRALTVIFVALLVLAALAAVVDFHRRTVQPSLSREVFDHTCREMVRDAHRPWRQPRIADANVLWCARSDILAAINEMKRRGPLEFLTLGWGPIKIDLTFLREMYDRLFKGGPTLQSARDPFN